MKKIFDESKSLTEMADDNMHGIPRPHSEHFHDHLSHVEDCGFTHPLRKPRV